MVALPPQYLDQYPRAKALLNRLKRRYDCKTASGARREQIFLEQVEQIIKGLEIAGSLVTQEHIVQIVGLSRQWLFLHPRVKARLQQFPLRQPAARRYRSCVSEKCY